MDQKRQFPRYAVAATVTIIAGGQGVTGRTSNLSRGGLCAMLPAAVTAGAQVTAELALVFENESFSEPLHVSARVVWCTMIGGQYQVGLAFLPPSPEAARFLDVFLKFLKEGKRVQAIADSGSDDPFES